ncbi:MAG: SpoIIE family protein phosphatase [Armatimonadetes bacterium]|nr:SpoIIE family protein phosphatase [Armatimonadota bacterium]
MRAWLAVGAGALYTVGLLLVWWFRRSVSPWARVLGVAVDIIMISVLVGTYGSLATRLKDVYYLVILAAGVWFRPRGAVVTALVAMVAYAVAYSLGMGLPLDFSSAARTLYDSGAFFMPAVAVAAWMLFTAQGRDQFRLARIDHEIGLARTLQDRLVPGKFPDIPGWEIYAHMERAAQVGGDFYDFLRLPDGAHLIILADMAGKSVYGLVHLSLLHSHIHDVAERASDLGELVTEVARRAWPELRPDSYAAAVMLKIWPERGDVEFVNCGHLPPLLVPPGGDMTELATGDPVIGARCCHAYRTASIVAAPGTVIVCYTDGFVEARSTDGSVYGEERLRASVRDWATPSASPRDVSRGLLADLAMFSGPERRDDQTLVVLKRTGS